MNKAKFSVLFALLIAGVGFHSCSWGPEWEDFGSGSSSSSNSSSSSALSFNQSSSSNGTSSSSEGGASSSSEVNAISSSEGNASSSSGIRSSSSIVTYASSSSGETAYVEELIDSRDGKRYKTVKIGGQIWMAENLNFEGTGVCFGKDGILKRDDGDYRYTDEDQAKYCAAYGRLYDWTTIMAGAASSDKNPSGVKGICPDGWHIPSDAEWIELALYAGDEYCLVAGCDPNNPDLSAVGAGTKLKAKTVWNGQGYFWTGNNYGWRENDYWGDGSEIIEGNGTDNFGFAALPGGYCYNCSNAQNLLSNEGYYRGVGEYGYWWTSTQYRNSYSGDTSEAYRRRMKFNEDSVSREYQKKDGYFSSLRCVKD